VANVRDVTLRIPESTDDLRAVRDTEEIEIGHTAERAHDRFGVYISYYVDDPFGYTVELMAVGEQ